MKDQAVVLDLFELTEMHAFFVAARQKEMATHSVTELVQAVRRPRSLSESTNRPFRKSGGGGRGEEVVEALVRRSSESLPRRNSESGAPPRRNSLGDTKLSMQCINEVPEKKQKKSRRRSFLGYSFAFSYECVTAEK
jgi:non-specific serine/threonine protein kinase